MWIRSVLISIVLFSTFVGYTNQDDSTRVDKLVDFFSKGHFSGQIRDFSMVTINHGHLFDYYANAIGAQVHYETLPIKGFSIGLNGLFVYRLFSNDLLNVDSISGSSSKYELQLFDVEHKGNYADLDRLEELYLKYKHHGFTATIGKMEIKTPLVNIHDGRMKPKVFSGIKLEYETVKSSFKAALYTRASPRSTTHWYSIEEAIGIYSNGQQLDGTAAHYHGNIKSKGLAVFNWEKKWGNNLHCNVSDYVLENISNTSFANLEWNSDSSFIAGITYLNQLPIHNGGSSVYSHTYYFSSEETHAVSGRLGYHFPFADLLFSGTHIFDTGRFIFPREFGVDPFYTFISRSQMEGLGDATGVCITGTKKVNNLTASLHLNRVLTSEEAAFNKYDLPSYDQISLDCKYEFTDRAEGLDLRLLLVYRRPLDHLLPVEVQHNKVNFTQVNLVANFNF
jgi:hypothetical protein